MNKCSSIAVYFGYSAKNAFAKLGTLPRLFLINALTQNLIDPV